MSGTLFYYGKMALVATVDLFLGAGVAYITNKWFQDNSRITGVEWDRAKLDAFYCAFQGVSTIFLGDEVRNLVYPKDFQDPTGGVIFMLALSQQPVLWDRMNSLLNFLDVKYHQFLKGGVRRDDDPVIMLDEREIERPADSVISASTRLGAISRRDAHLPGVSVGSLGGRMEV